MLGAQLEGRGVGLLGALGLQQPGAQHGQHRAAQVGGPDTCLRKLLLELPYYFNTPLSTIKTTWQSNTLFSYLPSLGVLVGGAVLKGVLGFFSSRDAAARARRNISDGEVTFEPSFDFLDDGMRAWALG